MNQSEFLSRGQGRLLMLLLWALTAIGLLVAYWPAVSTFQFHGPDDAMRLAEVRDLLNGQSWFDMHQYRVFPPGGVPMHWSRLVDIPLAGLILVLRPVLGAVMAERITIVVVPLALLLVLFICVYMIARRLGLSRASALLANALLATSVSTLFQFSPMRIDHHGWQILCGAIAMTALVNTCRTDGRNGLVAGLAMAVWMAISIEGLPYAVTAGTILALHHICRCDRWADLRNYMLMLCGGSALALFGTHYPSVAMIGYCDAMSPAYLLPLLAATAGLLVAGARWPGTSRVARMIPLAIGGLAGLFTFFSLSHQCLAGPFNMLDPIVYKYWFLHINEGLPIYDLSADLAMMIVLPSVLGLIGSIMALRRAANGPQQRAWEAIIIMQIAAFAVSLDVMRALSFAHVMAVPGNVALLVPLIRAAQKIRLAPLRVPLTAATAIVTPFGTVAATAAIINTAPTSAEGTKTPPCLAPTTLHGLNALPVSLLFTPLDVGSDLLVYTHHNVVATGHHRNVEGMKDVISAMLAPPKQARKIIDSTHARYFVYCDGANEVRTYAKARPDGLMAQIAGGHVPDWLKPVPMRPGEPIKVYRIVKPG